MSQITLPIGPQHPLLKEPMALRLGVEGERVISAEVEIGYVHRGIERLMQDRTYLQNMVVVERICGICSHAHATAYCQAVEALLGVAIPARAAAIRVLFCELERIHSHLLWLGVLAEAIGFTTIFMVAWGEREHALDAMEAISGGRIAHGANLIGGVRADLTPDLAVALGQALRNIEQRLGLFDDLIERDRSFHRRTQGIGLMTRDLVRSQGVVGPMARASGESFDVRVDAPYAAYSWLRPPVPVTEEGDVWARAWVRVREIRHSLAICRQLIVSLPEGPLSERVPRRVPAGETVIRIEAPRGELLYYIQSDGSDSPARVKVRTPTLPTLMALKRVLPGLQTGDIATVVAGADLCMACADR